MNTKNANKNEEHNVSIKVLVTHYRPFAYLTRQTLAEPFTSILLQMLKDSNGLSLKERAVAFLKGAYLV